MTDFTISELMYLTCDELCDIAVNIEHGLSRLEAGTVERVNALMTLRNIRRALTLRGCAR
jgi:hypothetical protein